MSSLVRPLLLCFLSLFLAFSSVFAHRGHEDGHHQVHRLVRKGTLLDRRGSLNGTRTNLTSPEAILERAQAIIAQKNKARLENPSFNKHEFLAPEELAKLGNPAPPLDLNVLPGDNNTAAAGVKRRQLDNDTTAAAAASDDNSPYTLPDEVIEAARIIAESVPQIPTGDQPDVAAAMRAKYGGNSAGGSYRPAKLQRPMGGLGRFGDGIEYSSNSTVVESASDGPNDASQVAKRDYGYWMADMPQLGASPYAPAGYKVWRNVKDFGAVGNGVHDDTAAIQLAITQGSRCGASCNSSTIVPAVVYFPPGTYLVSATIIQYYNTQFLGDPHNLPTLLAATSFTGGSVISSNVYTGDNEEWYLNTANFMRSIRNFKIDLRIAPAGTYLAGIHWQVAQASSLENIEFYMRYNSDTPGNTQQGIYMENGSGGFLADLTFVGGNFGAYMGNQQFTTSHLVFVNCNTAVQIHWDWAWTMHDYIIESCANGVVVVGGAGGGPDKPDGQGVGSLILVDSIIANTPNGIITTLLSENSTSFLLQNVGFFNVQNSIRDSASNRVLLAGGNQVTLQSWGFGQVNNVTGTGSSQFVNGANIAAMPRPTALLGSRYDNMPSPNIFTRRRPRYSDVPQSNILNVKALGAKGDGTTDDTAALNAILAGACNTSSIVYFPYGVYIVTDTLRVPIGSRIIGQAWSQIMGKGAKFQNEQAPRPVVQVALPGEVGIIEIQDMLFTVQGGTAGAVVVEWNAREQSPGSVGLWDTHIRVGGAKGSNLQYEQCPKLSGQVKAGCKAASLLMHLKPGSTAYMENAWLWVADHDLEKITKDQIDVYAGRGLLIESDRAWLWGTASEHAVLYQYQFSQASNIFMSMIQTESPYFQPTPRAPLPFTTGLFPNDPTFSNCAATDAKCFASWAVRIVDSSAIYMLGAGLYSWFYNYNQACVTTNNCQNKGFEVEQSQDIWIYNLCTKAIVEMISPLGSAPTLAADNVNGFLSSILAWLQGAENLSGPRDFAGFQMYPAEWVQNEFSGPATCKTALQQTIVCDDFVRSFTNEGYRGSLQNKTRMDSVCHPDCGKSLASWVNHVSTACQGYNITQADPALPGGRMWAGYNETCLVDPANPSVYCNDAIDAFTPVDTAQDMPTSEICSFCYVERLAMMQRSPYSFYDAQWQSDLEYVYSRCGITNRPTALHPPRYLVPASPYDDCPTDSWYTTPSQTTCDDLATQHTVSSASLFLANQNRLPNCAATTAIPAGTKLCLPPSCNRTLTVAGATVEECHALEANRTLGLAPGDIVRLNPWFGFECRDFNATVPVYGRVICLGAPLGEFDVGGGVAESDTTTPGTADGYTTADPVGPPAGAAVPAGTTRLCGQWWVAAAGDTCARMCMGSQIAAELFLQVNAGLGPDAAGCDARVVVGNAYCVRPRFDWDHPYNPSATTSAGPGVTVTWTPPVVGEPGTATTRATTTATATTTSTATATPTLAVSVDGSCGNGVTCVGSTFGNCCSGSGYCGSTEAYCGAGCQTAFGECTTPGNGQVISEDGSCGEGVTCQGSVFGSCCSAYGYCGSTDGHCGDGCQPAHGTCAEEPGSGLQVSVDGSCGDGVTCLGSEFGNCCSQYGWCGSSAGHCGEGCQAALGTCT